jgi:hypothetical protein
VLLEKGRAAMSRHGKDGCTGVSRPDIINAVTDFKV